MKDMDTPATADWRGRDDEVLACMRQSFSADVCLEY